MTLEKRTLRLGYMPLTDALPLLVAAEQGFFADAGLEVELSCEASWATVRDKLVIGALDAAQVLGPMLLASTLGLGGLRKPMLTAFSLGLNGNAITVSNALFAALGDVAAGTDPLQTGAALAAVIARRRQQGDDSLVFATVFPYSMHTYLLRYWLGAAGIDPDRDLKLVALPPSQMIDNLRLGHIDGYCVGEPWNSGAAALGLGHCLLTGYQIWQNAPEKMLGVAEQWADAHPRTHAALLQALARACQSIEADLPAALRSLAATPWLATPQEWLLLPYGGDLRIGLDQRVAGAEHFHVFHRYAANFPWRSHAAWMLAQMARWQQIGGDSDAAAVAARVWRSDLHRELLGAGTALPGVEGKPEGVHASPWQLPGGGTELGPDRFLDGAVFDWAVQ